MFVVTLTYVAPLDAIDGAMKAHVAYLNRHFEAGAFVTAGRQVPRTGGVILARAMERETLTAILDEDPFVTEALATYAITEFRTTLWDPAFEPFADPKTRPFKK